MFYFYGLEDFTLLRCPYSPDWSTDTTQCTSESDKLILKFMWNYKGPRIVKTVLKKKNKGKGLRLPNLKTYYKVTK